MAEFSGLALAPKDLPGRLVDAFPHRGEHTARHPRASRWGQESRRTQPKSSTLKSAKKFGHEGRIRARCGPGPRGEASEESTPEAAGEVGRWETPGDPSQTAHSMLKSARFPTMGPLGRRAQFAWLSLAKAPRHPFLRPEKSQKASQREALEP